MHIFLREGPGNGGNLFVVSPHNILVLRYSEGQSGLLKNLTQIFSSYLWNHLCR